MTGGTQERVGIGFRNGPSEEFLALLRIQGFSLASLRQKVREGIPFPPQSVPGIFKINASLCPSPHNTVVTVKQREGRERGKKSIKALQSGGLRNSPASDHQLVTSGFITVLNGVTGSLDISVLLLPKSQTIKALAVKVIHHHKDPRHPGHQFHSHP